MPFWTTAALAGAGIAGSLGGAALAKKGADKQADAATQASNQANATELQMYNQNRQDLAPWRTAGGNAVNTLSQLISPPGSYSANPGRSAISIGGNTAQYGGQLPVQGGRPGPGFNGRPGLHDIAGPMEGGRAALLRSNPQSLKVGAGQQAGGQQAGGQGGSTPGGSLWNNFSANDFQTDPGYDFRLQQGSQALDRSAAARGGLFSGGTLKDLTDYNQNFASNEYQNAYNRFQTNRNTQFNQLASVAGLGQTAAGTTAQLGANTANQVGQNTISGLTGAAAARASGYNAIGNGINSGIGGLQNWYLLSQLNRGGGYGGLAGA